MLAEPKVHLKITGREERMGWKKSRQSVSWLTGRPLCIIERRNARERKWHRQPTTALQIHLPFQNLQLYHFAISSSFSFFCNRATHQRVRPEREGTLFSGARTKEESTAFCLFGRVRDGKCAT